MKKLSIGAIGLVLILVCSSGAAGKQLVLPKKLEIGTSSVGGAYYLIGAPIAKLLEREFRIPVTAATTEGSSENVRLLSRGEINLGTVGGQVLYTAYEGVAGWEKQKSLRSIMTFHLNFQVLIALKKSGLTRLTELKGKRVGMGTSRPTWGPLTGQVFRVHGFTYEGDKWLPKFTEFEEVYAGMSECHTMLKDGLLSATLTLFSGGELPIPATRELMATHEIVLLRYEKAALKRLEAEVPYMRQTVMTAGVIPGVKEKLYDVAIDNAGGPCLTTMADVDEELVYLITKTIHKNLDKLAKETRLFNYALQDTSLLTMNYGIPYHAGAIRYWKEVGLWK